MQECSVYVAVQFLEITKDSIIQLQTVFCMVYFSILLAYVVQVSTNEQHIFLS